ncbi:putative hydrolase [Neisseria animaloris]|uniref:YheT family hydrolase n=1 Tax=Neisseria animaloris TaxID=326522 RepID=UPI000A19B113|nr:alpha/beta fold hydrolase [Neisseria animaloris]OSI08767.1 alpha/beta hydrolase [Neisseria animaloris]VEH87268.1 putative hydrolase [Neisseria animaloris]
MTNLPPLHTPLWLRSGNLETLYAKTLQSPPPAYRRELLPDSTGQTLVAYDFIDSPRTDAPLVVLFHGLEGSSRSHYAVALMQVVLEKGWNGVVAHFRSCGGVPNTAPVFYHSGDTAEIKFMLDTLAARYPHIYAVGVSLGGNVLAKYLGEQGGCAVPKAAAVVSAPVDLAAAGARFDSGITRLLYTRYFLGSLLPKARANGFHTDKLQQCKTLGDFDDFFTAPLHGFADRYDYYRRASCKPLLPEIRIPTLLLNAVNDPFLPSEALPDHTEVSQYVTLLQPPYGGHVGFVSGSGKGHLNWLPQTVLAYFEQAV